MQISRDPTSGASRGYGFLGYDSFEAADAAIEAMNNRFLANKPISVSYAMKKDGKGELHGSGAGKLILKNNTLVLCLINSGLGLNSERLLAKQAQRNAPPPHATQSEIGYPPTHVTPIAHVQPMMQPLPPTGYPAMPGQPFIRKLIFSNQLQRIKYH